MSKTEDRIIDGLVEDLDGVREELLKVSDPSIVDLAKHDLVAAVRELVKSYEHRSENAACLAIATTTSRIIMWLKALRHSHCAVEAQYALLDAATRISDGEHVDERAVDARW